MNLPALAKKPSGQILFFTDRYGVSQGYEPAFAKILGKAGLSRGKVITTHIYNIVKDPLYRKANEKTWRFNPEKYDEILKAFVLKVNALRPRPAVIVVSCPAVIAVLVKGDSRSATLEKMRGGVYDFNGIPCIVTYPITAIHQRTDDRIVTNDDGEADKQEPYRVPMGHTIMLWDWQKIGRFYHGKQRRLPPFRYSVCRTVEDCIAARDYLLECVYIGVDIETGLNPPLITCVGYTGLLPNGACHTFVIPFYDEFAVEDDCCFWESEDDHIAAWACVVEINDSTAVKIFQNGSYDCSYFIRDGAPVRNFFLDTMVQWWSMFMELNKSLSFISSVLLDNYQYWKDDIKGEEDEKVQAGAELNQDPNEIVMDVVDGVASVATSLMSPAAKKAKRKTMDMYWRYNGLDTYYTLWNGMYMLRMFQALPSVRNVYSDALLRLFSGLAMSMRGVKADFHIRSEHKKTLEAQRDKAVMDLQYVLADSNFNINSPAHKSWLLHDFFGLTPKTAKGRYVSDSKPKKGDNAPSAGKIPLRMAKSEHPFFRWVIELMESAMEPDKQISNICNMYLREDRFRSAFNPVGTETTRFSSKKSNFWDGGNAQNWRKEYRDWLVADEGHIFLDIDYSQSDDVFVAYESQDPDKIAVVESGMDAHAVNGELFFGRTYDWIVNGKRTKDPMVVHPITGVRQLSKKIVHGTNFQMAGFTLYVQMGREAVVAAAELLGYKDASSYSQEQLVQVCEMLMGKYRKKYKRLTKKEWYAEVKEELQSGWITNAYNISRKFMGEANDNGTQREATAFLGQSDTAGNMNRVMAEVDWGFLPKKFRDGDNPDYDDQPRRMTWDSHGIAFHIQVHDNFVTQLNFRHPKWQEAATNLLYVMDRPCIIKGRHVRIKAEAEISRRWGYKTKEWNGALNELEDIVASFNPKLQLSH